MKIRYRVGELLEFRGVLVRVGRLMDVKGGVSLVFMKMIKPRCKFFLAYVLTLVQNRC